jgi:hypothetical protein
LAKRERERERQAEKSELSIGHTFLFKKTIDIHREKGVIACLSGIGGGGCWADDLIFIVKKKKKKF